MTKTTNNNENEIMMFCEKHKITKACEFGVRLFITNTVGSVKEVYTIKEVFNLTIGQFGHDNVKNFFGC